MSELSVSLGYTQGTGCTWTRLHLWLVDEKWDNKQHPWGFVFRMDPSFISKIWCLFSPRADSRAASLLPGGLFPFIGFLGNSSKWILSARQALCFVFLKKYIFDKGENSNRTMYLLALTRKHLFKCLPWLSDHLWGSSLNLHVESSTGIIRWGHADSCGSFSFRYAAKRFNSSKLF